MPADPQRVQELFHELCELPPEDHAEVLDRECGDDLELRERLQSLLNASREADSFLDKPAAQIAPSVPQESIDATVESTGEPLNEPQSATGAIRSSKTVTFDYKRSIKPGVIVAERYALQELIGEGGMGEVWVAKQTSPVKRKVALKLVKPGMDSRAVLTRFEHERQALALMDHPNIARVLDAGVTEEGRPFFVMELVNGLPLNQFCDEALLTPNARLELFVSVCRAVQHAHQKGIVHRDLKPANVLVTMIDGQPLPKVIDFGVAKALGGKLTDESLSTHFGSVIGTFEYMSPEQAAYSGVDIDTRADIYSLGVVLYELLTGLRPIDAKRFSQAAYGEMVKIIREEEPSKPSTRLSTNESLASLAATRQMEPRKLTALLRGELDWVVMKCLEKNRDRRYETANGLARDIQRYLADEPVDARPPSAGYRFGKFVRRHRKSVIAVSMILVMMIGGIVGTSLGLLRAWDAEKVAMNRFYEAEEARAKAEKAESETLDAYQASMDDVIAQLIASKPEIGPIEKRYLETALERWQAFADRQGSDDRSLELRAEGYARVATLWNRLGQLENARNNYNLSRDGFQELVNRVPQNAKYRWRLTQVSMNLGVVLGDLGQIDSAREEFRTSRMLAEKLVQAHSDVPKYHKALAETLFEHGTLMSNASKYAEAIQEYRAALSIFSQLNGQREDNQELRENRFAIHHNIGYALDESGNLAEALSEYQTALAIQTKVADEYEASSLSSHKLALVHDNIARLYRKQSDFRDAVKHFQESKELRQALVIKFPAAAQYHDGLANTHNNLGITLLYVGDRSKAQTEYESAKEIYERLIQDFPNVPDYRYRYSATRNNLANLLNQLGRPQEALAEFRACLEIYENLCSQFPDVPRYRHYLGMTRCSLGYVLDDLGENDEAELEFSKALKIQRALVLENRNIPDYRMQLSATYNRLAILHLNKEELVPARENFEAGIKIREELVKDFPNIPRYKLSLGGSYCNFGVLIRDEGNVAESMQWFDKAVDLLEELNQSNPENVNVKTFLKNSLLGRAKSAKMLGMDAEAARDSKRAAETK